MKANEPEKFKECISEAINEVYYRSENELWYKGYYRRAAENAEKMVRIVNIIIYYKNNNYHFSRNIFDVFDQLESVLTEDEKPKYLDKFRRFVNHESFFGFMVELVKPKESLAVLCHGDCWTNNFLFQYDQDGTISGVTIVIFY